MADVDELIRAYRARANVSAFAKLDMLMDIEQQDDVRVLPFLLAVLEDRNELPRVRSHVLKDLRDGPMTLINRAPVADAMMRIVSDAECAELRLEGALALGEFTDLDGVVGALGTLALDAQLPIDVRYSAFISLGRAGPGAACIAVLRQLSSDETLGRSANSVLSAWQVT